MANPTAKMILKEIEIEGFRSFKDKEIIQLPPSGLALISGNWVGSSRSSGSGKSSIPMAIAFALGICDIPSTSLKNKDSKKISVRLKVESNGITYDIMRDPKLTIAINGVVKEQTATGAEEDLAKIIGTSTSMLKALTYRAQREQGQFMQMTDSETKEFLSSLLGLDELESASDRFSQTFQQLTNKKQVILNGIANCKTNLEQIQDTPQIEQDRLSKEKVSLESQIKELSNADQLKSLQSQESKVLAELKEFARIHVNGTHAEILSQTLKSKAEKIRSEIIKLEESICFTCNRHWEDGKGLIESKRNEIRTLGQEYQAKLSVIAEGKAAEAATPPLYAQLDFIKSELHKFSSSGSQLKSSLFAIDSVISNINRNQLQKSNYSNMLKDLELQLSALDQDLIVVEMQQQLLSRQGFLSVIFDEVLSSITSEANDMIAKMPNVAHCAISLNSTSQTKAGNTKKSIVKRVLVSGDDLPFKALSGGQQASIELCVDLAVSKVIKNRIGTKFGWITLDEAMDGLGVEEKQAAVEIIKENSTGLVLMIDHATEVKEMFDRVIEVEFNGRTSRVS
jgi:DNA repair exonuclease SbcCD ATPase subunit